MFGLDQEAGPVFGDLLLALNLLGEGPHIIIPLEQFFLEGLLLLGVDAAATTLQLRARLTLIVRPDVVIVGVGELARGTHEGLIVPLHVMAPTLQLAGGFETFGFLDLFGTRHLLIDLEPAVQRPPYAA